MLEHLVLYPSAVFVAKLGCVSGSDSDKVPSRRIGRLGGEDDARRGGDVPGMYTVIYYYIYLLYMLIYIRDIFIFIYIYIYIFIYIFIYFCVSGAWTARQRVQSGGGGAGKRTRTLRMLRTCGDIYIYKYI